MLQLVNLSNYKTDLDLIQNSSNELQKFLDRHDLDGVEMMFCASWDKKVHRKEWIHGVHLKFWPSWLDFWRGDRAELLRQLGTKENIIATYGGLEREDWLNLYRTNIREAKEVGAKYIVFHVCHNRQAEVFDWQFSASDQEVIEGAIEVVNELVDEIPPDMTLLFENLWWPGLTLLDKNMLSLLLKNVRHPNVGIMLDTGHLMNTNQELLSQEEGIDYIIEVLTKLGDFRQYIRGVHLHYSLSGAYVKQAKTKERSEPSLSELFSHVLKIDQHLPFTVKQAKKIIELVQPDWLVHEFVQLSLEDWEEKIAIQQQAIGLRRAKNETV